MDVSTLREPYRIEGKKTLGLELAEHFGWTLPDAIVYPTGGGTGLIGMWKAFRELRASEWIKGALPRMYTVQAAGCAPVVQAFDRHDLRQALGTQTVTGEQLVEHIWKQLVSSLSSGRLANVRLVQSRDLSFEYAG